MYYELKFLTTTLLKSTILLQSGPDKKKRKHSESLNAEDEDDETNSVSESQLFPSENVRF